MRYESELQIAVHAAQEAGILLQSRENMHVDSAEERDIKLSSDKMSEQIVIKILAESGIPILSEESGFLGAEQDYVWIVDPIDGTSNYYRGMNELSCVSISLWKKNQPILGVVNRFALSELYYGVVGVGSYLNGSKIQTSNISKCKDATMATGFPVFRDYSTESLSSYIKKVQYFKKTRMLGSAALMSTMVAAGRIDAYFEDEIMIWDIAAGLAITMAAGGEMDLTILPDHKCLCRCFANAALMEDYHAKGL